MRMAIHLALVLLLVGCQGAATGRYDNALARDGTVIPLPATAATGQRWQDLYLVVDYALKQDAGRLAIEGSFSFAQHPRSTMRRVHDLKLFLFTLNSENRVLDYRMIARAASGSLNDSTEFRDELPLAAGATAIAFGYEGELTGEDPLDVDIFRMLPRVKP